MTTGWTIFVIVLTVGNVIAAGWLMLWSMSLPVPEGETTGHVWDGDIVEGNNPLPRWWLGLFWITIAFSVVFCIAYPAFGDFSLLGWSQQKQYEEEVAAAEEIYGKIFAAFAATPVTELAGNPDALSAGRNLFVNNCAQCHGSDGRGARGFPNLTDAEWQWGGAPEQILSTISNGRTGVMPALGAALGPDNTELVVEYVQSLAGRSVNADRAAAGQVQYNTYCIACHGPTGAGNPLLGALPLDNEIWRHGSGASAIRDVIVNGRTGEMPGQEPLLGTDRVHVLAAYVLSLAEEDR
jgi:cytochrome c oxidase cbb3-type subunit 3